MTSFLKQLSTCPVIISDRATLDGDTGQLTLSTIQIDGQYFKITISFSNVSILLILFEVIIEFAHLASAILTHSSNLYPKWAGIKFATVMNFESHVHKKILIRPKQFGQWILANHVRLLQHTTHDRISTNTNKFRYTSGGWGCKDPWTKFTMKIIQDTNQSRFCVSRP